MVAIDTNTLNPEIVRAARSSSQILSGYLEARHLNQPLISIRLENTEELLEVPVTALSLLVDILLEIGKGNSVSLLAQKSELSTTEAAEILNVSRPFVVKLLESGAIPYRKVGRYRRIDREDLMTYKEQSDRECLLALDELVAQAQELDMGY